MLPTLPSLFRRRGTALPRSPWRAPDFRPSVEALEQRTVPQATGGLGSLTLTGPDAAFLQQAVSDNLKEIIEGNFALHNSTNPLVQWYAQILIQDHQLALVRLAPALAAQGITDVPIFLNQTDLSEVIDLAGRTGADFDSHFLNDQFLGHALDIQQYSQEAQTTTDPAVQQYVSQTLVPLQVHFLIADVILHPDQASMLVPQIVSLQTQESATV